MYEQPGSRIQREGENVERDEGPRYILRALGESMEEVNAAEDKAASHHDVSA